MSDMNTLLEIALRDSRNLEVIIALDRLIILPESEAALHAAMKDLETVKSFINTKLPGHLKEYARGCLYSMAGWWLRTTKRNWKLGRPLNECCRYR